MDRLTDSERTFNALVDVANERDRQNAKWGEQRGYSWAEWGVVLGEECGEVMMECTKNHFGGSRRIEQLREELVQTAAVAVAMIEEIDRNSEGE